jgi:hypothetical protein
MKIKNKQDDKVQCMEFKVTSFGKTKIIALEPVKEAPPDCLKQMQISITDRGNVFYYDLSLTLSEANIIRKFLK